MPQQKTKIPIPKDLGPSERIELSEAVIEFVRNRTKNGTGYRKETGRNYSLASKPYTKSYAGRKGVSRSNVDLTLSTEMLESIELLTHSSGSITIGYEAGTDVNAKAEGNQIGSYGRAPDKKKARPFLGLTKADLDAIMEAEGLA